MYLDQHYPFEMVPLNYPLTGFDDFLDFQTMSIHYNQIYKEYIDDLNHLLENEKNLQNLTLDEILFNPTYLPASKRENIIHAANGVYNHQVIFQSMNPNPVMMVSVELKNAIEKKYHSMREFYQEFKKACLSLGSCGFVFLVCDEHGDVHIEKILGSATTVPLNLCPILGIDLYEHAYYLNYKHNIKAYVEQWMKYICFDYANQEYDFCLKAIQSEKEQPKG